MQEKLKELESMVEKYIATFKELKIENATLKSRIDQLEFEKRELLKKHSKSEEMKYIKNFIIKKVNKISEKLLKLEKELTGK